MGICLAPQDCSLQAEDPESDEEYPGEAWLRLRYRLSDTTQDYLQNSVFIKIALFFENGNLVKPPNSFSIAPLYAAVDSLLYLVYLSKDSPDISPHLISSKRSFPVIFVTEKVQWVRDYFNRNRNNSDSVRKQINVVDVISVETYTKFFGESPKLPRVPSILSAVPEPLGLHQVDLKPDLIQMCARNALTLDFPSILVAKLSQHALVVGHVRKLLSSKKSRVVVLWLTHKFRSSGATALLISLGSQIQSEREAVVRFLKTKPERSEMKEIKEYLEVITCPHVFICSDDISFNVEELGEMSPTTVKFAVVFVVVSSCKHTSHLHDDGLQQLGYSSSTKYFYISPFLETPDDIMSFQKLMLTVFPESVDNINRVADIAKLSSNAISDRHIFNFLFAAVRNTAQPIKEWVKSEINRFKEIDNDAMTFMKTLSKLAFIQIFCDKLDQKGLATETLPPGAYMPGSLLSVTNNLAQFWGRWVACLFLQYQLDVELQINQFTKTTLERLLQLFKEILQSENEKTREERLYFSVVLSRNGRAQFSPLVEVAHYLFSNAGSSDALSFLKKLEKLIPKTKLSGISSGAHFFLMASRFLWNHVEERKNYAQKALDLALGENLLEIHLFHTNLGNALCDSLKDAMIQFELAYSAKQSDVTCKCAIMVLKNHKGDTKDWEVRLQGLGASSKIQESHTPPYHSEINSDSLYLWT